MSRFIRHYIVWSSVSIVVIFAVLFAQHTAATDTRHNEIASQIQDALAPLTWLELRNVQAARVDSETPTLVVFYQTRETAPVAYRAEMLEVFRAIGGIELPDGVFIQVGIVPEVDMGLEIESLEMATISTDDMIDFARGDITRTDFLDSLSFTPMEHFNTEPQNPA
jgi:hypothetical protein